MSYESQQIVLTKSTEDMGFIFCCCISSSENLAFFGEQANPHFRDFGARVFVWCLESNQLLGGQLVQISMHNS